MIGGAGRFVWNKIERRFTALDAELAKCRQREAASVERRAVQLTVIELLWQEVRRLAPDNPALIRGKKLLDDLKEKGREDAEGEQA